MKTRSITTDLILASAAPGLLLLAFILQLILTSMAPTADEPIGANVRIIFLLPLFELLLMVSIIGLIWAMNAMRGYGRIVSITYLVVGLIMLYSNALLSVLPLPDPLYVLVEYASPGSFVGQASAGLAALGLVSLWFWSKPTVETPPPLSEAVETAPEN